MAYGRSSTITIPAPSGTRTDFTFCIRGTLSDLKTVANGGYIQNTVTRVGVTCPADFALSLSSTGSSPLSFGFAKYVATTGEYELWVKIASWTASFTMYALFGDVSVVTYQGGAQGSEFDSFTKFALHFPDGTTLSGKDFSANAIDFTPTAGAVAGSGVVDGAVSLNGSSNNFASTAVTLSASPMVMTWQCWAFLTGNPAAARFSLFTTTNANTAGNWSVEFGSIATANSFNIVTPGLFQYTSPANSISQNAWYHIAFTRNGTGNTYAIYINGVSVTVVPSSGAGDFVDSGQPKNIGQRGTGNQLWAGLLDEMKYCTTPRAAGWIADEYANQLTPTTIPASASTVVNRSLLLLGA